MRSRVEWARWGGFRKIFLAFDSCSNSLFLDCYMFSAQMCGFDILESQSRMYLIWSAIETYSKFQIQFRRICLFRIRIFAHLDHETDNGLMTVTCWRPILYKHWSAIYYVLCKRRFHRLNQVQMKYLAEVQFCPACKLGFSIFATLLLFHCYNYYYI